MGPVPFDNRQLCGRQRWVHRDSVFGVLQEPDLPIWKRYPLSGLGWGLQEVTAFCPSLSDIDPASGGSFVVQGDLLVLTIEL